jgi:oligosaccharide repeat unit polymerase
MPIISLFCLVATILSAGTNKKKISPVTMFYGIWTVITGFYSLNIYGYFSVSTQTVEIIAVGLFAWGVGASLSSAVKVRVRDIDSPISESKEVFLKPNLRYKIALVITLLVLLTSATQGVLFLFQGYSLQDIRYILRGDVVGATDTLATMYIYVASPLSYLIIHYCSVRIFYDYHKMRALVVLVVITVLTLITEGGRFILYFVGIDLLVILFYKAKERNKLLLNDTKKKKSRSVIVFGIIALICGFIIITMNRGSEIFNTIYSYMCGCIPLLDVKIAQFTELGEYSYGFTSLNGFIRPVATLLRSIGIIHELPTNVQLAEKILSIVETPSYISDTSVYNGFVSMFYAFFVDFGILGVIILSFLWGLICERTYIRFNKTKQSRDMLIYLLILQALSALMLRFMFVSISYALSFVYFILIFMRIRKVVFK